MGRSLECKVELVVNFLMKGERRMGASLPEKHNASVFLCLRFHT
jgi:hypothetical protein